MRYAMVVFLAAVPASSSASQGVTGAGVGAEAETAWTVDRVARRSLETSNDVHRAEARLDEAAAARRRTAVNLWPRTSVELSYTRLESGDNDPLVGLGVDLGSLQENIDMVTDPAAQAALQTQLEVLDGLDGFTIDIPANRYRVRGRLAYPLSDLILEILPGLEASRWVERARATEVRAARNDGALQAVALFLDHVLARAALEVSEQALEDARTNRDQAEARRAAELSTRPEVLRFESRLAEAEQERAAREADVLATAAGLRTFLNLGGAGPVPVVAPDPDLGPGSPSATSVERWVQAARDERPEIEVLTALAEAQREETRSRWGGAFPSLSVSAQVDAAEPNIVFVPPNDRFRTTVALGAQLTWSPDQAAASGHAAAEADARRRELLARLDAVRDRVETEVRTAHARLLAARVAFQASLRRVEAADEALRGVRASYEAGLSDATAVIESEVQLSRARLSRVRAGTAIALEQARLRRALGESLAEPPIPRAAKDSKPMTR
ncbi:MAG: TolC family protein [Myxococcota bacterium]